MISLLIDTGQQGESLPAKHQELNRRYNALQKEQAELEEKYKKALEEKRILLSKINALKEQNHLLERNRVVSEYVSTSTALDPEKKIVKNTSGLRVKVKAFIDIVGTSMSIGKLQYLYNRHKTEISNGWYHYFLSDIARYSELCKKDHSFYERMQNDLLSAGELRQIKTILEFLRDCFFPIQKQYNHYQTLETKFNKAMALLLVLETLPKQSKIKMSQWNELLRAIYLLRDEA